MILTFNSALKERRSTVIGTSLLSLNTSGRWPSLFKFMANIYLWLHTDNTAFPVHQSRFSQHNKKLPRELPSPPSVCLSFLRILRGEASGDQLLIYPDRLKLQSACRENEFKGNHRWSRHFLLLFSCDAITAHVCVGVSASDQTQPVCNQSSEACEPSKPLSEHSIAQAFLDDKRKDTLLSWWQRKAMTEPEGWSSLWITPPHSPSSWICRRLLDETGDTKYYLWISLHTYIKVTFHL